MSPGGAPWSRVERTKGVRLFNSVQLPFHLQSPFLLLQRKLPARRRRDIERVTNGSPAAMVPYTCGLRRQCVCCTCQLTERATMLRLGLAWKVCGRASLYTGTSNKQGLALTLSGTEITVWSGYKRIPPQASNYFFFSISSMKIWCRGPPLTEAVQLSSLSGDCRSTCVGSGLPGKKVFDIKKSRKTLKPLASPALLRANSTMINHYRSSQRSGLLHLRPARSSSTVLVVC